MEEENNWEKRFDDMWMQKEDALGAVKADDIKDFIKQYEAQVREKIEGLRKPETAHYADECGNCYACDYDEAIDDVLKLLSQSKKEQEDN